MGKELAKRTGNSERGAVEDQPRLKVEHRVFVVPAPSRAGRAMQLEQVLDKFHAEHGPGWELVNSFQLGVEDHVTHDRELMFVFQRRSYLESGH
ncbi:MAG: hypothetical protein ACE363_02235 [Alphaproteobacteria bacterium]